MIRKISRLIPQVFLLLLLALAANGDVPGLRQFDEKEMTAYAADDDFAYMNLAVRPPSIWQRIQWWFGNLIAAIFGNANASWLSDLLFYGLLIAVLGVAVWYIIKLQYGGGTTRNERVGLGSLQVHGSDKSEDFDRLIQEALKTKDYRLAIRYAYLKSLIFLSEKDLIKLKDWKSPYDYNRELSGDLAAVYQELSRLFEYVWYGDFAASQKEYEASDQLMQQLIRQAA